MNRPTGRSIPISDGLLQVEDCLDADGGIDLPDGITFISLIDRNIAHVGDEVAYRYLDFSGAGTQISEITWTGLGVRMAAVAARVQHAAAPGERVAVLAPQGLDYIAGFFGAIKAGAVAVPLFAPELPGHAERLDVALRDSRPAAVLTTSGARAGVEAFLDQVTGLRRPEIVTIDEVPDAAATEFVPTVIDVDDVSHLQYTGGATRPPAGVEITHRAVGTNLVQMILSIDLLDRNTHGVSWLPLYHDMGLSMIGFPAVYGGHSTLMSPTAFIRRPLRWIEALSAGSATGRVVTAAPNFAYEWAAARGVPGTDSGIDLANVVLIIGSEPVSIDAISAFDAAFAPFGLPPTAFKPSYGIAEATLLVATIAPAARAQALYVDRDALAHGTAVPVAPDHDLAAAHVSCGQVARSLSCVIVDPDTGRELPDGRVGEPWLQGDNIARGYWHRPQETQRTFGARLAGTLAGGSHAIGADLDRHWLRTGDLGFYLDGELYITGRIADVVILGGRRYSPHDLEATAAGASPIVRRGYVAAFAVRDDGADRLVIVAERAAGTARTDPGAAVASIKAAVYERHQAPVADVRIVPAGAIPRTTSGKLARRACRTAYLDGIFDDRAITPRA
ncbi:fatty-acid--CoA ligase [Mycolicibacterium chubuense]|uniref:Long-chain-fatty-acid--AMP ligase FadD32 n=1 Tax=Mycolicibacterium chubuense TaxID=1800 RepID=A0A0J6WMG4_MYCCU|nr:fatty acyl-AMP ligase [Mycolicibacterium chubuense]KMO83253.1 Long-chain-fatty-acid--AMP ligase FadD32 [Mycolicibacterium chubuense]ORA43159.1 fatty-acid--CoA ligase [Mycolicibacterium chubuense]SPX96172.1 acyl-CoA synthetase (AMP-forming)/AMP-acid ligase II [Mycolicibacterium chubuense]